MVAPIGAETLFNLKLSEFAFKKDLIVVIPVVATLASVTYDVGYFQGLDLYFFTLFSLAEHLVFAAEALPMAIAYFCLVLVTLIVWDVTQIKEWFANLKGKKGSWETSNKTSDRLGLALIGCTLVGGALAYHVGWWEILVLFIGQTVFIVVVKLWREILMSGRAVLMFGTLLTLIAIYASGYRQATAYVADKTILHRVQLTDGTLEGRIIRTGERGVLMYLPMSEEITLIRWDQVKAISRKK
jgi:hypothetical protein